MGSCQTRYRNSIWRATYVVKPQFMAEDNASWFSAVFSADTDFQLFISLAAALDADFYQLPDTILIDAYERVFR